MTPADRIALRRQERRAAGLCTECGKPAQPGGTLCPFHYKQRQGYTARFRAKMDHRGLCQCGSPRAPGKSRCSVCLEIEARKTRERTHQLKEQGLCQQCGKRKTRGSICSICRRGRKVYYDDHRIATIRRWLRELVDRNRIALPPHLRAHVRYYLGAMVMLEADPSSTRWRPNEEACRRYAKANPEWEGFALVTSRAGRRVSHRAYLVTRTRTTERRERVTVQFLPTSGEKPWNRYN